MRRAWQPAAALLACAAVAAVWHDARHGRGGGRVAGAPDGTAPSSRVKRRGVSGGDGNLRLLVVHKRLPDLSTGCDKRLAGLVRALVGAGANVTYVAMPVSGGEGVLPHLHTVRFADAADCVAEGEAAMPKGWLSLELSSPPEGADGSKSGVSWFEMTGRPAGPWGEHFCQRLATLVRAFPPESYDAVIMPVWFWPHGGAGGSELHSLAHQVLPALRALVDGREEGSSGGHRRPALVSLSDDAFSARYRLLAQSERGEAERQRLVEAASVVASKETAVYRAADVAAFISAEDMALTFPPAGDADVVADDGVATAPWAPPDIVLLRPSAHVLRRHGARSSEALLSEFRARSGLVFLGSGAVATNYQGIQWFLAECWPALKRAVPDMSLTIAGSPPAKFAACRKRKIHCNWEEGTPYERNASASGVITAGYLPDTELASVLGKARLFLEPIVKSTGINTKVYTGYEHQLPVIMTRPAASGLGVNVPNVVTKPTPEAFVNAVLRLHSDAKAWVEALAAQEAHVDALNKADAGRHDAEALVEKLREW